MDIDDDDDDDVEDVDPAAEFEQSQIDPAFREEVRAQPTQNNLSVFCTENW